MYVLQFQNAILMQMFIAHHTFHQPCAQQIYGQFPPLV
jgi:hypothetical protein